MRFDSDAAVSLAVQLLSEPLPWPVAGLDEPDLSAMGGGARDHDRYAGALVSSSQHV